MNKSLFYSVYAVEDLQLKETQDQLEAEQYFCVSILC